VGPAAAAADGFTAGDRTNLRLDPRDEALVRAVAAANPRTVVVLMAGGAVITESWRHDVAGLVLLWYPGMEGGHALADILLGRVAPSGRMPFTVPTEHAHLPPFNPRAHETTYDLWHGYRLLDRDGVEAAFPFGFGLSYTTFGYDDLVVTSTDDGLIVDVDVTNTGAVAADEVVQVYVEPPGVEVVRPRRQLAGFTRVSAAPGVSVRARVSIDRRAVAYFDEGHDAFALEHGEHRVVIARDAQAAPAASTVVTLQACLLPD
jgi:beta-glucosidase